MSDEARVLYIIPARGGSKRLPGKNIKPLAGKPLICYSIDVARAFTSDDNICVSTDDDKIIETVEDYGLKVPFKRPANLATDDATTNDVLLHALDFYKKKGRTYDIIVLLQPTSPLRKAEHVQEALSLFSEDLDMVVSVKRTTAPSLLCKENKEGFLVFSFENPKADLHYEYNGAVYVINANALKKKNLSGFTRKKKYVMDEKVSVDIDTELDWKYAEFLMRYSNK